MTNEILSLNEQQFFQQASQIIDSRKQNAITSANQQLILMYWEMGKFIKENILIEERGTYGNQIVATLSRQLVDKYGRGFSKRNLHYMMQFFEAFRKIEIVQTLSA